MDADTSEAHDMMEKHYKYSQEIFDIMETGIPDHSILCMHDPKFERELSNESLQQLLRDAPKLAISCQLSPAGEWVDTDMLKRCNDISVLQVKHTKKQIWLGTSPRSLLVHIALKEQQSTPRSDSDEDMERNEDHEIKAAENDSRPQEHQGAIYCKHCQMWLNGPTQWADHEIGKKHRKAVRRMHSQTKNDDSENGILPPIPDGFGKKPFLCRDGTNDAQRGGDNRGERYSSTDHIKKLYGASDTRDQETKEQYCRHPDLTDFFYDETSQWRTGLLYPVLPSCPAALPDAMQ
jgi:hypothetical protein